MTINQLIAEFQQYDIHYAIYLGLLPAIALVYSFMHKDDSGTDSPHSYIYSGLVHLATFGGVTGIILTCYSLFILQSSLLDVSFVIYFLPIISMIFTVYLVSRIVSLGDLPGIERLSGLLLILAVTFILTLIVLKTRIFMFFGGSVKAFGFILLVLFALIKWGSYKLLRKNS